VLLATMAEAVIGPMPARDGSDPVTGPFPPCHARTRHVLVDTLGLLMQAIIRAADIRGRDGSVLLVGALFGP
jgi:hypothetical protein